MTDQPPLSGTELRSSRLRAGLSRAELARQVGVASEEIAIWEAGDRAIECTSAVRQALAAAGTPAMRDERRW